MIEMIKELEPTISNKELQDLMQSFENFCKRPVVEERALVA